MTTRRDVLKLALIASVAAAPSLAEAGDADAAIFATLPALKLANAAEQSALDAYSAAEDRCREAVSGLTKPAQPPYGPRSAWGNDPLPIIRGKELPTSPEADWDAYNRAFEAHRLAVARLKEKFRLRSLDRDVTAAGAKVDAITKRILALRARTLDGMAVKFGLCDAASDHEAIVTSLRADIEALTGHPTPILA